MARLQVLLIRMVLFLFRILPESTAMGLGKYIGLFWFHVIRYRRALVMANLRLAFSNEKTEEEITHIARKNFIHYGLYVAEFLRLPNLSEEAIEQKIRILDLSAIETALAKGKGLLIICGHYGNFDLMAIAQSMAGLDGYIITKKIRNKTVNAFWQGIREAKGVKFLPKKNAMFTILRLLKKNNIVVMIFDQHMGKSKGVRVNFFNRPASTMKAVAMIALKTGTPVVPIFNWREGNLHYLTSGPEISLVQGRSKEETILRSTQRFNDVLEAFIRKHPEQWTWIHRRWK